LRRRDLRSVPTRRSSDHADGGGATLEIQSRVWPPLYTIGSLREAKGGIAIPSVRLDVPHKFISKEVDFGPARAQISRAGQRSGKDRKSTRLNSSHVKISY